MEDNLFCNVHPDFILIYKDDIPPPAPNGVQYRPEHFYLRKSEIIAIRYSGKTIHDLQSLRLSLAHPVRLFQSDTISLTLHISRADLDSFLSCMNLMGVEQIETHVKFVESI